MERPSTGVLLVISDAIGQQMSRKSEDFPLMYDIGMTSRQKRHLRNPRKLPKKTTCASGHADGRLRDRRRRP